MKEKQMSDLEKEDAKRVQQMQEQEHQLRPERWERLPDKLKAEVQDVENEFFRAKITHARRLLEIAEKSGDKVLERKALKTRARMLCPYQPAYVLIWDLEDGIRDLFCVEHDVEEESVIETFLTKEAIELARKNYASWGEERSKNVLPGNVREKFPEALKAKVQ
jgi:hypothetical protein